MNHQDNLDLLEAHIGATNKDKSLEDLLKKVILKSFKDIKKMAQAYKFCKRKSCGCAIIEINLRAQSLQHFIAINGASGIGSKCSGIKGACGCSHAEPRAIIKYLKTRSLKIKSAHIKTILLTTFSSCVNCANIIIDSKVIDAVSYEFLAKHWTVEPHDAKSKLDRNLLHFSKKNLIEDTKNKLLRKLLTGKQDD